MLMFGINPFHVCLLIVAVLAAIFQAIGFFAPAWMIFSEDVDVTKMSNLGRESVTTTTTTTTTTTMRSWDSSNWDSPKMLEPIEGHEDSISSYDDFSSGFGQLGGKIETSCNVGLWLFTVCFKGMGQNMCKTNTTINIQAQMNDAAGSGSPGTAWMDKIMPDWKTLQVLAVLAVLCAAAGKITLIILIILERREQSGSAKGFLMFIVTFAWLLSGVFIFAAVGKQATQLKNLNELIELTMASIPMDALTIKMEVPWALVMSGFGGFFAFVIAGAIPFRLLCVDRREAPGTWNQLTNRAV